MAGAKITFDYSLEEFKKNAEALSEYTHQQLKDVILEMTRSFASTAARYTWPDRGKRTIPRGRYFRQIIDLKNEPDLSEIDAMQLRAGRRWKVIYPRAHRRREGQGVYFKNKTEAQKAAVIKNRGLARAMWGTSLPNIGVDIPENVKTLLDKSPNLNTLGYSRTTLHEEPDLWEVLLENLANSVSNSGLSDAEKIASENTAKRLNYMVKALADKESNI